MAQLLLFPDPHPLVDRLGRDFFRRAPLAPGVYLMRDRADTVLYVGKAKNLRRRLASYRVANPDRMPRRHLRLLRTVERIELQTCADEAGALAREAELLRTLRPKYNRAGTWPGPPRYVAWRLGEDGLALVVAQLAEADWDHFGPLGGSAFGLRAVLVRLIWCAVFPENGIAGLPERWFSGTPRQSCTVPRTNDRESALDRAAESLQKFFSGQVGEFTEWILARTGGWTHSFDLAVRDADLETLVRFAQRTFGSPR